MTRRSVWIGAIAPLAIAGLGLACEPAGRCDETPPLVPAAAWARVVPMAFPFAAADLRGQVALVFFGFTHCEGVCPATLQVLRQVERALAHEGDGLRTLLISVDGERDTPAVMKAYLEPFGPGFIGITGAPAEVTQHTLHTPKIENEIRLGGNRNLLDPRVVD